MAYERLNLKNGQTIKEEHFKHIEDGIENASALPDWNQNDKTAADYVKGRTHYDNSQIITETSNSGGLVPVGYAGSDRKVHFHENSVIEIYYDDGRKYIFDSNSYVEGEDLIATSRDTGGSIYLTRNMDSKTRRWNISVSNSYGTPSYMCYKQVEIVPLEEKYIPDTIARAVLISPNGAKFKIVVGDNGTLSTEEVTE